MTAQGWGAAVAAAMLLSAGAAAAHPGGTDAFGCHRDLERGDRHRHLATFDNWLTRAETRALQRRVRAVGCYEGRIDGVFGPKSRAALKCFLKKRGDLAPGAG